MIHVISCTCMVLLKNEVKHHFAYVLKVAACTVLWWWYFCDANDVYVNMVNTKVVDNFVFLFVLKFHDFRPADLGVIDFRSLLSGFACPLNRYEWLYCLAYFNMESCIVDNRRVVVLLLSFPICLRTPFLVV